MSDGDRAGDPKTSAASDAAGDKRRWQWLTLGGTLLVLAIIGILIAVAVGGQPSQSGQGTSGEQSASPRASGSGTNSSPGDETPAPPDPDETIDNRFGEPVADTVAGDGTADFGDQVTARLTEVTPITVTGTRAGEVSGPAIRVTIELSNGTSDAVTLDTVTVNAYFGSETQPASPFDSETEGEPFTGSLAAGATAQGTYVFSVPEGQGDELVVTVSKDPASPLVVFTP